MLRLFISKLIKLSTCKDVLYINKFWLENSEWFAVFWIKCNNWYYSMLCNEMIHHDVSNIKKYDKNRVVVKDFSHLQKSNDKDLHENSLLRDDWLNLLNSIKCVTFYVLGFKTDIEENEKISTIEYFTTKKNILQFDFKDYR